MLLGTVCKPPALDPAGPREQRPVGGGLLAEVGAESGAGSRALGALGPGLELKPREGRARRPGVGWGRGSPPPLPQRCSERVQHP